jgi:type II secretory pathway pseudopilin PulG
MDATFTLPVVLSLVGAAAAGALLGALPCVWRSRRALREMQNRLAVCEQARQAAVDRSQQARAQIGQLSKALTDLTDARRARHQAEQRAADMELTRPNPLVLPRAEAGHGFGPTQVFTPPQGLAPTQVFPDTQMYSSRL